MNAYVTLRLASLTLLLAIVNIGCSSDNACGEGKEKMGDRCLDIPSEMTMQEDEPTPAPNTETKSSYPIKLVNDEASLMGSSLAFANDTVFVGQSGHNDRGAGFIFQRQADGSWKQTQMLTSADLVSGDLFGNSASLDGDFLAVGAVGTGPRGKLNGTRPIGMGAVYVFKRTTSGEYRHTTTLRNKVLTVKNHPGLYDGDRYGRAVALKGNHLVACADLERLGDQNYIGRLWSSTFNTTSQTWSTPTPFSLSPLTRGQQHCQALSFDETNLVVGSPFANLGGGFATGQVNFLVHSAEGIHFSPVPDVYENTKANAYFGASVAVLDDTLAVGSIGTDKKRGSVDIFIKNSEGQRTIRQTLSPTTLMPEAYFGNSLALTHDALLVGAQGYDKPYSNSGIVYVFRKEGEYWVEHKTLQPSDIAQNHNFGVRIAANGDFVAIARTGAVYIYDIKELLK